jgi:hypothetical protein
MGSHFGHFNRRDIRLRFPTDPQDPWYAELQDVSDGFDRPRYHVTRAVDGPATEVKPGDTIWLVAQLYAPWGGSLPATLDGRIDVVHVTPSNGASGFRFGAADTSRWFHLTDATAQLRALQSVTHRQAATVLWKDQKHPIGKYLRRMRQLANGEVLQAWEAALPSRQCEFSPSSS